MDDLRALPTPSDDERSILTRRQLMIRGAAAGLLLTGAGALRLPADAAAAKGPEYAPPIEKVPPPPIPLFADETMTFQALFALGNISAASGEYGEIASVVKRIQDRGATYRAFYDEFTAEAERVGDYADIAARRGRRITARNAYLRSAAYYAQSLYFALIYSSDAQLTAMACGGAVPASSRAVERRAYRRMRAAWERAGAQMRPQMEVVQLPWSGPHAPMPGWFLRPANASGRRPTLLMNNGSDAQAIDLWGAGAYAALERGWNVLVFDGPGQGAMLFERNQTFIPHWEKVITPIVDWLLARDDVDPDRIALSGSSFGGYMVTRAAAFETRLAAVSADPGVVYAGSSWTDGLGTSPGLLEAFAGGDKGAFNAGWSGYASSLPLNDRFGLSKRLEIYPGSTMFEKYGAIVQYDDRAVAGRIRTPMLVIDNQVEQFFPGQPKTLYRLLTRSTGKRYVEFTVEEGAQFHCEPMAPQRRNDAVMDFLEDVVGA